MRIKLLSRAILYLLVAGTCAAAYAQNKDRQMPEGRAAVGKVLYKRYCVGCHGPQGDGNGENATWIDPKPRDFTAAVFKCRSTPTGALPTEQDLFDSVTRGFVTTNMPPWKPLTMQNRADLVAYIKTFSPRWTKEGAGKPITIPPEPDHPPTRVSPCRGFYRAPIVLLNYIVARYNFATPPHFPPRNRRATWGFAVVKLDMQPNFAP